MTILWAGTSFNGRTCSITSGTAAVAITGNLAYDLGSFDTGGMGMGFYGPDDRLYCIAGALSYSAADDETTLTLARNYVGTTVGSGGRFDIVSIQGLSAAAAFQLNQLVSQRRAWMPAVTDLGANNLGAGDQASFFNWLGNQGGTYRCPNGQYKFDTSFQLPLPVQLYGECSAEFSNPAAEFYFTAADDATRITLGNGVTQTWGHGLHDLRIVAPNATGGIDAEDGSLIFANFASQFDLSGLRFASLGATDIGVKFWKSNSSFITDVRAENLVRALVYGYANGLDERSDIIDLQRVFLSGNSLDAADRCAAVIEVNGAVNTITGDCVVGVQCGRFLYVHNDIGSDLAGNFFYINNGQMDFPKFECIYVRAGSGGKFVNCYFHGSQTSHNILILDDRNGATNPVTDWGFVEPKISGAWKNGVYAAADAARFTNPRNDHNSIESPGVWSAFGIAPGASDIKIIGAQCRAFDGNAETHAYAVRIDGGSPLPTKITISPDCTLEGLTAPTGDFVGDIHGSGIRCFGVGNWTAPGNITHGNQTSTTVTCAGAVPHDVADVQTTVALDGCRLWGEITAANTCTVYLSNNTGSTQNTGALDLDVTVFVRR